MIQVTEKRVRSLPARRISAEEFCTLASGSCSTVYRPHWEVLRMLTVGEAWGTLAPDGTLCAAALILPMEADTALAAGLRSRSGALSERAWFITPPVGNLEYLPQLLKAVCRAGHHKAPSADLTLILEPGCCGLEAETLCACLDAGFSLRALRPLDSLAPLEILTDAALQADEKLVSVPIGDEVHLALLLARGWAVTGLVETADGWMLHLTDQTG